MRCVGGAQTAAPAHSGKTADCLGEGSLLGSTLKDSCMLRYPSCLLLRKREGMRSAGRMIKNIERQAFLRDFHLGVTLSTLTASACLNLRQGGGQQGQETTEGSEL